MMQKRTKVGLAGALLVVASAAFGGQTLAADKIGVIDMRKVLSTSTAGKKAQGVIEQKMKTLRADFKKDEDELIAIQKDMEKKGSAWSDAVKKEKAAEFQKKRRDLAIKQEAANQEMRKLQEEQVKPLQGKVLEVAKKVAADEDYDIILPREVLIVAPDKADITDKVIEEVNKVMK